MKKCIESFKVVAKSVNTNSFGLYQMIVVNRDGLVFKTHASYMYAKDEGEYIIQHYNLMDDGRITNRHFVGHEMTTVLTNEIY